MCFQRLCIYQVTLGIFAHHKFKLSSGFQNVIINWKFCKWLVFFFLSGFSSQTLTIQRAAGEGTGPFFIPLYHFHLLTNIKTFICNFACEMTITIFNRNACVYQTATRWDLPPYRITIWVIDWWCNVFLFTWWIDIRLLLQRFDIANRWIWTRIVYQPCITSEPTNQVC